jgi:hypothetical protein
MINKQKYESTMLLLISSYRLSLLNLDCVVLISIFSRSPRLFCILASVSSSWRGEVKFLCSILHGDDQRGELPAPALEPTIPHSSGRNEARKKI